MSRHSTNAMDYWRRRPFHQPHKVINTGDRLHNGMSGMLFIAKSNVSIKVDKCIDGVSFAFDARGNTIRVELPSGELTQLGKASVDITGVASLTRAGGLWTHAGS